MAEIQNNGGGVNLGAFLNKANANPDGNVRMNSAGTEIKAESFFKKAVSWMTNTNQATRQAFRDALTERYGPEVATYALSAMRDLRPDILGDQPLSALEIKVVNSLAAEQERANTRPVEPSIARFSPPRGRDVDLPSVNSLQRGPTTRSHAPLTNRQPLMESGIESPQSTPISPAAKELARESAIDRLGQIESSSDAVAAFNDQKDDLRQDLEAAVGKFGCDDIMRRLENKAKAADSEALQTTAYEQMRILDSAAENFAVTSARFEVSFAENAHTKAKTALKAAEEAKDPVKTADMKKATTDTKKIVDDATQALTDAQARNPIRPETKNSENENGW